MAFFVEMFSWGFFICSYISYVFWQAFIKWPFTFTNVSKLAILFCTLNHVYYVSWVTVYWCVDAPCKRFCFNVLAYFDKGANNAWFFTFCHAIQLSSWIWPKFWCYFGSNYIISNVLLTFIGCKGGLIKHLCKIWILTAHWPPVLKLDGSDWG